MAARAAKEPDPPRQIAALVARLDSAEPTRGVLVRGEERWFRESAIRACVAAADRRGLEISKYDALDPDFALRHLCDDLSAPPMFASARCVVVRNATQLLKKEGGEDAPLARALAAYFADASVPGMIVLDAEGLAANTVIAKLFATRGVSVQCRKLYDSPAPWDPDPRGTELVKWLVAEARTRRVKLDPDEAVYVAAATGNDLSALIAQLERIGRRGGQSLRETVGWASGGSPFDLAEDLCRGDPARSLAGIEALFRLGFRGKDGAREVDPAALQAILLGTLRGKLRQAVSAARAIASGATPAEAAERAGVPAYPKAREEFEARLRTRPLEAWARMIDDLARLERSSRSGSEVDASDLARLALRWRVASDKGRGASRSSAARR